MKQPMITGLFLCLICLYGCGFEERRQQLDEREQALNLREQAVMLKEKEIRLMEDSVKKYAAKMDSASRMIAEPGLPLPDSLAGSWNVTMVCTKTNCAGAAVGDIRKENWLLGGTGTVVSIRAMQGSKLIRIYTGTFTNNGLKLATPETETSQSAALMQVELKVDQINKMSGQRLITQADGCETVFKVDMDRSKNQ